MRTDPPHLVRARVRLFFFSRSADHRDLHSFPTRRSSDLVAAGGGITVPIAIYLIVNAGGPGAGGWGAAMSTDTAFDIRSEEHTSELQSLRHLVCRLLLEKKK